MTGPESRFARQVRLPGIGSAGQDRLRGSTAALVGLGALGCVSADLLARAGVGRLLLLDRDVVEWSNLQRQSLYTEDDARAARPKAEAAADRLRAIDTGLRLEVLPVDLHADNLPSLLAEADLAVDGTDNFATRYLLNDWAVREGRPFVYAGVVATYGMAGAILPGGPCLRCTWPEPPDAASAPTCRSAGVLGPAVAAVAALAAGEAVKILCGADEAVFPGFRYLDLWSGEQRALRARRDPDCPACAGREFDWLEGTAGARGAEVMCGGDAVQLPPGPQPADLDALAAKLDGTVAELRRTPHSLRFVVDGLELHLFADGRALVRGTEDAARARSVLARTTGG
jgi:molybdopterin/thiamine biosynthesis adenylyltransferase